MGAKLEFRTAFSVPEDGAVTTIKGKQSVNLPFVPTMEQLEVTGDANGKSVTIWPSRKSAVVADCDVTITVG